MPTLIPYGSIHQKLKDAASRGGITLATVGEIANEIDAGQIASVDASNLLADYDQWWSDFQPDAKARFDALVDRELASRVVPDVVAASGPWQVGANPPCAGDATYAPSSGQPVVDGVSVEDPLQGQAGDCFLISSLAALALQQPKVLESAIQGQPDESYRVTFYAQESPGGAPVRLDVPITGELPVSPATQGKLYYAHDVDPAELWPDLIEKAYAKWKGGYDVLGRGGEMTDVLEALTGRKPQVEYFSAATDPSAAFQRLKGLLASGCAVVAGSHNYNSDDAPVDHPDVVFGHAYTVTRAYEDGGHQWVELRNPWGYATVTGKGTRFTLTAAQYVQLFEEQDWVAGPPLE